jgi:hypothetical protein
MDKKPYQEFSPVNYAAMDDPPALIMHENTDEALPIIHGELMYSALKKQVWHLILLSLNKQTTLLRLSKHQKVLMKALA